MATHITDKLKFNNGDTYILQDSNALPLTGGTVTGPVTFNDSVSMDEATVGDLVVNGNLSTTNNIQANTINGVSVGSNPKFTDTTYSNATTSAAGLMSSGDKSKLDGIAAGAQVNAVTSVAGKTGAVTLAKGDVGLGNVENKSSATIRGELTKDNVTAALGYTPPTTNTTYSAATTSAAGLMSASDKSKLDGIAAGAQVNAVTSVAGKTGAVTLAKGDVGLGNVENKSSATIRGELTKANVTTALGYTPPTTDTNTWRGIQDNLTSSSTTDSLSAKQGKWLKDNKAEYRSIGSCADYQRVVIALCELSANANSGSSKHTSGSIVTIRSNGLVPEYVSQFVFQDNYGTAKSCNYSFIGNFENTSTTLRSGEGFRACTFTYNSKYYGGLEFYQTQARAFYWYGEGDFDPFIVAYYNANTSAVLNTEINNSISHNSSTAIRRNITVDNAKTVNNLTVQTAVPANAKFTDTTYSNATTSVAGLMSSSDKSKLDGITAGAQVNAVTSVAGKTGAVTLAKSDVGLGNVGNFKAVSTVASQGLTDTEKSNARANIGAGTSSFDGAYSSLSGKPTLGSAAAKDVPSSGNASTSQVVMGNDTRLTNSRPASDVSAWAKASSKPSYTASEVGAIPASQKGAASGVAELDANGLVPASQLPSYVDDILEYTAKADFPSTGETGKIYVDTTTNLTYRWSGTAYVEISASLALGTTSSTAFRGDYGNTAYAHATDSSRLTTAKSSGLYKIATTAQGHIASVTAVAKSDITGLGIPAQDTTYSDATTSTHGLMSSSDKSKLNGIASGAEVNQNAFSNVKVGSTTVAADGKTDTLELAGSNVTLTPDATNDKVTIGITKDNVTAALGYTPPTTNTTYSNATTSAAGLMSSGDKSKLDGIAAGAQVNAVTSVAGKTGAVTLAKGDVGLGNVENKSSATIRGELTKANVTDALGYTPPTTDTNTAFSYMPTPGDNRSVATTPNSYSNKLIFQGIKSNSTIGNPSTDSYSYVVGLRGWSDSSGGDSYEVAFNNNGLFVRHGATTSWNGWEKVYTSGNLSKSTLGLGNVENKSSATIRGELTSSNVTTALGFVPKIQVSTSKPSHNCTWFKVTKEVTT